MYYDTLATEIVATAITTMLQYDNTILVANATTKLTPANETFSMYGAFGQGAGGERNVTVGVPGIPTDILPDSLVYGDGNYAATVVYPASETISFVLGSTTVSAPTSYEYWDMIGISTSFPGITDMPRPTSFAPTMCGTWASKAYNVPVDGQWTMTTNVMILPSDGLLNNEFAVPVPTGIPLQFAAPILYSDPPGDPGDVFVTMPTGIISYVVNNPSLSSQYPYITDCVLVGGEGQPTVHIAVAQLTSTSSHVITMQGVLAGAATSSTRASTPPSIAPKPPPPSTMIESSRTLVASGQRQTSAAPTAEEENTPTSAVQTSQGGQQNSVGLVPLNHTQAKGQQGLESLSLHAQAATSAAGVIASFAALIEEDSASIPPVKGSGSSVSQQTAFPESHAVSYQGTTSPTLASRSGTQATTAGLGAVIASGIGATSPPSATSLAGTGYRTSVFAAPLVGLSCLGALLAPL